MNDPFVGAVGEGQSHGYELQPDDGRRERRSRQCLTLDVSIQTNHRQFNHHGVPTALLHNVVNRALI